MKMNHFKFKKSLTQNLLSAIPRHLPVDSPRFPEPPVYKTFEKKEFFITAEDKTTEYKGSRRSSGK